MGLAGRPRWLAGVGLDTQLDGWAVADKQAGAQAARACGQLVHQPSACLFWLGCGHLGRPTSADHSGRPGPAGGAVSIVHA